jgi:6,7-dimethyl-8-ribityllumazine synthase
MRNPAEIYDEITNQVIAAMERYGVKREHVCAHRVVSLKSIQDAAIRQDFEEGKHGRKTASLRSEIAKKYKVSEAVVANAIYRK